MLIEASVVILNNAVRAQNVIHTEEDVTGAKLEGALVAAFGFNAGTEEFWGLEI